jgi:hypothetical protein
LLALEFLLCSSQSSREEQSQVKLILKVNTLGVGTALTSPIISNGTTTIARPALAMPQTYVAPVTATGVPTIPVQQNYNGSAVVER